MSQSEVPVLIVGAGPVGMMGAILLRQLGIETRLVERRDGPIRAPAAHVVNARTLEICRGAGVDMEALLALAADPADAGRTVWKTHLAGELVASSLLYAPRFLLRVLGRKLLPTGESIPSPVRRSRETADRRSWA